MITIQIENDAAEALRVLLRGVLDDRATDWQEICDDLDPMEAAWHCRTPLREFEKVAGGYVAGGRIAYELVEALELAKP